MSDPHYVYLVRSYVVGIGHNMITETIVTDKQPLCNSNFWELVTENTYSHTDYGFSIDVTSMEEILESLANKIHNLYGNVSIENQPLLRVMREHIEIKMPLNVRILSR